MDDFQFPEEAFQRLSQGLTPQKLQALGLPSSLTPTGFITSFLKKLIPGVGKGLLNKITGLFSGQTKKEEGFFKKLAKTIWRVIDALLGLIVGVIGGALVGAGAIGFAGIAGGLTGIANEPTTIHIDNKGKDSWVKHGDKSHEGFNDGSNNTNSGGGDSHHYYNQFNQNDNQKDDTKPIRPVKPTEGEMNFMD